MRKFTLLILSLFFSVSAFSQLALEGFEGSTFPPANWAVFDNGVTAATNVDWSTNATAYAGTLAAYMNRPGNIGQGNTSEDYLVTGLVTIPVNGQLRFYARTFTSGNTGTMYQIKTAPASATQTDFAAYTNLVVEYTEDQLTLDPDGVQNPFSQYTLKIVNFPASMYGQQVYVAFVLKYNQVVTGLSGDRWLLDNVEIVEQCLAPSAQAATPLATSAALSWTGAAVTFEIENIQGTGTPTGVATHTSSTNSINITGLLPNTQYCYYVRSVCSSGTSAWTGPFCYTTTTLPPGCGGNFTDPGGSSNYANNVNSTTTICPENSTDLVTVHFTSFNTENCCDHLYVYYGSSATGTPAAQYQGTTIPPDIVSAAPGQCLTFVFTSDGSVTAAGWVANVTCAPAPACSKPITLVTSAVLHNTATLSWTQPANPDTTVATTWHVLALPCGSPAPTAASTGWIQTTNNPYVFTGLNPDTCYTFYVRAACSDVLFSDWSTGINATTQVVPPACGGTFTDPGGSSAAYANNVNVTTTICPDNSTDLVTVHFNSFATENCCDHLYVYYGSSATGTPAAQYQGTTIPPDIVSAAPGQCLTFVFTSDGSVTAAGWVANVTCAPAPTCSKPIGVATSAVLSTSAIVSWNQPPNPDASVASAWQVLALPCGSPAPTAASTGWVDAPTNPFTMTGLSPDTCYTFYVRAVCSPTDSSDWSNGVNATTQQTPPACGGTFADPGGVSGNYANNLNVTTTICPDSPTDLVTVHFNSFNTENCCDHLYVYYGSSATGTPAAQYQGTTIPPDIVSAAPGQCITFVFTSDGSVTAAGWVADVTCAPAPSCSKPISLTATINSSTSATLNWTQPNNPDSTTATTWEVVVQAAGAGVPTGPGTIVTSLPYTVNGLTPGTNYEFWVRAICSDTDSSAWAGPRPFYTQVSCGDSQPFCGDTGLTYTNVTGAPSYGSIDCLFTTPNPAWYFMQVNQAGNLTFQISQTSTATGNGIDVDFACWGPFNSSDFSTICGQLYDFPDGNTGIPDNVVGCSYSAAPIENFTIPNAVVGQYYIVLITNFSNQPGTVNFVQTNNGQTGAGGTNCNLVCSVELGDNQTLCNQTSYTITSTNENADSYAWYNGTTLIPGETGSTLTVTQSGTYTCEITCGLNTADDSVTITFVTQTEPTFDPITVCQGTQAPTLPTSSTNVPAVTGTWSPATIDTSVAGVYQFTFTPDAGQCASVKIIDVTVNDPSTVPTFDQITVCQGLEAPALPTTSINGITGTWSPAVIDTSVAGVFVYTFTPNSGQCATNATMDVTINAESTVPTFDQIANICQGLQAPDLPTISINNITGTWSPSTIDTSVVGTVTYTFTPNPAQCAVPATMDITIDAPSIVPTFEQVANICQGLAAPTLSTVSDNGISGIWSPATIDTSVVGPVLYTFTPNAGQCAVATTMTITIDAPSIVPSFEQIANICQGLPVPSLPTTSTNGIAGSWSPATIDSSIVGPVLYTFTPNAAQCAVSTTMTITIDAPSIVPSFTAIPNTCINSTAPVLPTTSTNGITGSWSPATIDTTVAGTVLYTFTPNAGQCAVGTTMNVTILNYTVAAFTQIAPVCQGSTAPSLSGTSNNGITGTWSPSVVNTSSSGTVEYVFTPDAGQCASGTSMFITVHPTPDVLPINDVYACDSYTLPSLTVGSYYSAPNGQGPITNLTLTTSQTVYVYAQSGTSPNCVDEESFTVSITQSPTFTIEGDCVGPVYTLAVVPTNAIPENASYQWVFGTTPLGNDTTQAITETGSYSCTITISNGDGTCSTTVQHQALDVFCIIPKGISPNGDGDNDYFDLRGYNVTQLNIYNRYGTIVYSHGNYSTEWHGQSDSNQELPDGTYYYVIDRANGESVTGWVYINRKAN